MYIEELIKENNPESLAKLERSMANLTTAFGRWVDLNQSPKEPNEIMLMGLSSIETMRNTISHHLTNQYGANDNKLMRHDVEMLESSAQQLNKLLLIYHNIEGRLLKKKDLTTHENGLGQIANSIEETHRLYRHSKIPNKHPEYMGYEEAVTMALEKMPFLNEFFLGEGDQEIMIKDGVHYYELDFMDENDADPSYTLLIDATNGQMRGFELKKSASDGKKISQKEAIDIARDWVKGFYQGEMKEEMFYIKEIEDFSDIYAFRFTPIIDDIQIVSDAYIVNIASTSGEILKFINDFRGTEPPRFRTGMEIEEIQEKYQEEFGKMDYNGLAVVRSFYTQYQPKLAYSFKILKESQEKVIFIDRNTGAKLYQLYHVYHPIFD